MRQRSGTSCTQHGAVATERRHCAQPVKPQAFPLARPLFSSSSTSGLREASDRMREQNSLNHNLRNRRRMLAKKACVWSTPTP